MAAIFRPAGTPCASSNVRLQAPKIERHWRGDIAMRATPQLRHRLRSTQPRATFSAWAMSIVFAAIAMISFAVDQSAVSSLVTGRDLAQSLGEFGPVRLIQSLIDTAPDVE
jgi:hypothetical protein